MKAILVTCLIIFSINALAVDEIKMRLKPEQDLKAPFRLFDTDNIFTKIALDTETGRVYQVHFSADEKGFSGILPINDSSLLLKDTEAFPGRFTLYETDNIFNFILVDQFSGRFWQVQWNNDKKGRIINFLTFYDE